MLITSPAKFIVKTLTQSKIFLSPNLLVPFKYLLQDNFSSSSKMDLSIKDSTTSKKGEGMLVKDIVKKLESWAPLYLAGSWDRVGLQVEPSDQTNMVRRVLLTNDLTEAVVKEAIEKGGVGMIISYHPPIFQPLKTLTTQSWKERVITACIENKIAVYSPHTAWDCVYGGVNDWLAKAFDSSSVKPITISKCWTLPNTNITATHSLELTIFKGSQSADQVENLTKYVRDINAGVQTIQHTENGDKLIFIACDETSLTSLVEYIRSSQLIPGNIKVTKYEKIPLPDNGEGRLCFLKNPYTLKNIVDIVKNHLKLKNIRLAIACNSSLDSTVNSIALCAGSGTSVLSGVRADVFLTGEMGHHDVLEANHKGTHVIICEHSNTERGFLCSLVEEGFLHKLFDGAVDVIMSSKDKEPLLIV